MPKQAATAPDTAVVFSANNLLPWMPKSQRWDQMVPSFAEILCPFTGYHITGF